LGETANDNVEKNSLLSEAVGHTKGVQILGKMLLRVQQIQILSTQLFL